jgi:hypothetical protein
VNVKISKVEDVKAVWNTPATFQTAMLCGNLQGIDKEWRFGYQNEELPYQSAILPTPYEENSIAIEQPGKYRIAAEFDHHVTQREFQVVSSDSGNSVADVIIQDRS